MQFFPKYRCFTRYSREEPHYAQDHVTMILLGRYCHMYNVAFRNWFFISEVPKFNGLPTWLNRPTTKMNEISLKVFLHSCGRRAHLELAEDFIGFRITSVAQFFYKWRLWPLKYHILGWVPYLKRLAFLDDSQDWSEWHKYEIPHIGEIVQSASKAPSEGV